MANPFAAPGQGNSPLTDTMAQMKVESAAPASTTKFSIGNTAKQNALIKMRAQPGYEPSMMSDPTEWVRRNYGAEYLNPDGSMPTTPMTYTGGENGQPRIGSAAGISYLPWDNKNNQFDVNGQDYSRPQYANGPNGMPTGGAMDPAAWKAERDAGNFYKNGHKGLDPSVFNGLEFEGLPRDTYELPNGGTYTRSAGVSPENPWGRNASYSGPDGNWNEDHWGNLMDKGIYAGHYPGEDMMRAWGLNGFESNSDISNHLRPGMEIPRGGQGGGTPGLESSDLPWRPGIDGPDPRDEDVGRSWNNMDPIPGIPGTGGVGGDVPVDNSQAGMDALRRALMQGKNWG